MKQEDLQQIKDIVDNSITEHIKPSFDETFERLDIVEYDVKTLKNDVGALKDNVSRLPDKDYLDKKLFILKGGINKKLIKHERKHNLLNKIQKEKGDLNEENIEQLKEFDIFPNLRHAD